MVQDKYSRAADSSASPPLIQGTAATVLGLQGHSANSPTSPSERGQVEVQGQLSPAR